jgi:crotonobetainyl-CoA:carnitine CoA-transferase CaiB-like acyl-CoA transferase
MAMALLDGIRVLDLTNVLAGPFATLHLALLGAEVIKIENPKDGDLARKLGIVPELNDQLMGTSFLAQNANKKSVTLNTKSPAGKEIFRKLAATADVLVENFRPDVMDRLGLGYAALSALNPRLVYCAISGFGHTGPDALKPAYDQIIQGLSGVMAVNGDALSSRAHRRGAVHRRRPARFHHAVHGLGGRQSPDRWPAAGADGQRQLHRRAVRHVQDAGRARQHRGQQAGTVGIAL